MWLKEHYCHTLGPPSKQIIMASVASVEGVSTFVEYLLHRRSIDVSLTNHLNNLYNKNNKSVVITALKSFIQLTLF